MNRKPSLENRYVLFSNGSMLDLLDPLVFKEDIETTVASVAPEDGTLKILDCANSPLKIFTEIIGFMEKNKSKNITFKNYISQSNYLIGSNNANDRGEVINF